MIRELRGRGGARYVVIASLLFVASISNVWAKGRKPSEIRFTVEPATVTAGRTLTVWCESGLPFKTATLLYNNRTAHFFPTEKNKWRALMGIGSMVEPGIKRATFTAEMMGEEDFQSTVSFRVVDGTYSVSRVKLSRVKNKLITSGQLSRDGKVLSSIYKKQASALKLWSGYFILPTTGIISSAFGTRRTYDGANYHSAHSGLDIANEEGTEIVAPNQAVVAFSGWLESLGNVVLLDHGVGVYTYYLHMKEGRVQEGDRVLTGTVLGIMGSEGLATGPHLHWSMAVAGEKVEAMEWMEKEFR